MAEILQDYSEDLTNIPFDLEEAKRQQVFIQERRNRLEKYSNMGKRLESASFENFIVREGSEVVFEEAKKYTEHFDSYETSLLIWGPFGNGKSYLSAAITNELRAKGKAVVFITLSDLLARIRSTFQSDKESEQNVMYTLLQCDLLVLDDIGAEKPSDWVSDILFRIVDGRYRNEKPILYTSNLKPSELAERLGRRIYDRILESNVPIQVKASSYREQMARKRFEGLRGQ
jgi:DNA replication protein DnaC